jgi:hypothetical protein
MNGFSPRIAMATTVLQRGSEDNYDGSAESHLGKINKIEDSADSRIGQANSHKPQGRLQGGIEQRIL